MPFQTSVTLQPAPGIEGHFASADPHASALAGPGALVAGPNGLTVARFAWIDAAGVFASNAGAGTPTGFVHNEGLDHALVTTYLAETSNLIPPGFEVTLMVAGVFWVKTKTTATIGQKIFASNTDGSISTGASGATVAGSTETKWFAGSVGAAGELIKMSSWNMG